MRIRAEGLALVLAVTLSTSGLRSQGREVLTDCPPEGDATADTRSDPDLNVKKSRTIMPASFEALHFDDLSGLEIPEGVSKKHRSDWPQSAQDAVAEQEGRAVSITGFLIAQKLEGQESCNCHSDNQDERDIHLWLANSEEDTKADALVVEVAPRIHALHSSWTRKQFQQLAKNVAQVRISGWVLMDEEHPEQVDKTRVTLWEIHPIMKIEVRNGNQWKVLN